MSGRIRLIGLPTDSHSSFLRGAAAAPTAIRAALYSIPEEAYEKTFRKLASAKWKTLKGNIFSKKAKLQAYMLQKGFESKLVSAFLKEQD